MEINEEEDKYKLFQTDLKKENDLINKIKDIFKLQYFEKFQDILILQKHQFLEQIEQEVLFILKKIYSDQIMFNNKFNSLFKSCFKEFQSKYNTEYREIHSKYDFFLRLKSKSLKTNKDTDIEALNFYYISNFRRHCLNHTGPALHKCGHAEKGKFIKIVLNSYYKKNNNNLSNESIYIICEECKKVFTKDLFNNYCSFCKENYLCSILSGRENKDGFLISYLNPHCDTFINRTIPCKLCKEKLYVFIEDKKIKCLKCNYVIDMGTKNEFNWQCPKCDKYFKSNIKFYNPCENLIIMKILKKALLLKIKAKPQFMNCCKIDINNTPFYHKKECKGLLYLCNIENYFLKNKKWAIICEKCQAINNCKNFIWTCPKCGKRIKENINNYDNLNNIYKKEFDEMKEISLLLNEESDFEKKYNKIMNEDNNDMNKDNGNNNNNLKINLNKRYLYENSLTPSHSQLMIKENQEGKNKENDTNLRKSANEIKKEMALVSRINMLEKENLKLILIKKDDKENNNNNRCYLLHRKRDYQINTLNNINNIKNNEEKAIITKPDIIPKTDEKIKKNNNYEVIFQSKIRYNSKKNILNNNLYIQEKENNDEKKVIRCGSYKSNLLKDNNEENKNINIENNQDKERDINKNKEQNISTFVVKNRNNIPFRLKYGIKEKNENNEKNIENKISGDSFDDLNKKNNNNLSGKNEEEFIIKKNLIYTSVDGGSNSKKSSNGDERISKETTSQCSKGSVNSLSRDINNVNSKPQINQSIKPPDISKIRNSVSPNYNSNFKNKRKYYIEEKEKPQRNDTNNNEKNNYKDNTNDNIVSVNKYSQYRYKVKNYTSQSHKLGFMEKRKKEMEKLKMKEEKNIINNDKPDDVIEPQDIDFSQDIQINDPKIKQNKTLYSEIQTGLKKILEKGHLPQFNIDNYTIEKKIGDGAFGVLFSVSNNKTKKKYALKKLTACDLSTLEDFQKEFEIAYNNNHNNILNLYGICVRVYDITTYILFVLMDLAEHDWEIEINNRFKEKKYYTENELIEILKQLSSACIYLQKKEIAHRDIKPENILLFFDKGLDSPAVYKICDFGEAKEKIRVGARHKSIRGTDYYMSPILFKGLMEKEKFVRDDPYKSDVFSLGYCMIIAAVLDFDFINKIRNLEEQTQIDRIIREALEERYSYKFIYVILKMIVHREKERIDFLGLEKLINNKL